MFYFIITYPVQTMNANPIEQTHTYYNEHTILNLYAGNFLYMHRRLANGKKS